MNKNYIRYKEIVYSAKGLRMLILFITFFILFGILGMTIANTYDQTVQKNKQIAILEDDVRKEEDKQKALLSQQEYFKSDTFIEKEARGTLGLSYPNEEIYLLKKNNSQSIASTETKKDTVEEKKEKSSIEKWLDLIFG